MFHYVESPHMFTGASWSLAQPDVIFLSDESGKLQVGKCQTQNFKILFQKKNCCLLAKKTDVASEREEVGAIPDAGHLREGNKQLRKQKQFRISLTFLQNFFFLSAICPFVRENDSGERVHYMSVGDETGTLHLLELPLHLRKTSAEKESCLP